MFNNTDSRKISHREVFLEGTYRLSVKGAFLLQKPPLFQSKSWIKKFTRKGAFTDKVFRTLRSATKGSAFRIRHLLKKVDENFCFCCNERVPCAEIAISHKTKARNSVQLQAGYLPVEPKPPSPRSVSESSVTSSISGSKTGIITICATLSCG